LRLQAQRRSASPESTVPVTVPRSVSRSRRWRCAHPHNPSTASTERVAHIYDRSHNTPATSANSAERTLSSVRPSVSGTADLAARPLLEEPTPSRKTPHTSSHPYAIVERLAMSVENRTMLTAIHSTPAAAATRSTIRRLREIAEV
jgi:hypothetical protein